MVIARQLKTDTAIQEYCDDGYSMRTRNCFYCFCHNPWFAWKVSRMQIVVALQHNRWGVWVSENFTVTKNYCLIVLDWIASCLAAFAKTKMALSCRIYRGHCEAAAGWCGNPEILCQQRWGCEKFDGYCNTAVWRRLLDRFMPGGFRKDEDGVCVVSRWY